MWADARDLSKAAEVASLLRTAGLDADALMGDMQDPEIKGDLIAATESAAARGVFGSPTFFVGDEMFFGQDRLDVVEETLTG